MKETYTELEMEVIVFDDVDIITSSHTESEIIPADRPYP